DVLERTDHADVQVRVGARPRSEARTTPAGPFPVGRRRLLEERASSARKARSSSDRASSTAPPLVQRSDAISDARGDASGGWPDRGASIDSRASPERTR